MTKGLRPWRGVVLVALAFPAVAADGVAARRPIERTIAYLESPERARWQKPDEVVHALGVKSGERIADLGAGSGYFALRLARAAGESGKVVALDVDGELLAHLSDRARRAGLGNVETRRVPRDSSELAPESVDLVFLCDVYHHLRRRVEYLRALAPALRADGRIVVIDFRKSEDVPEGPPLEDKVDRDTAVEEFRRAGLRLVEERSFLPHQYFLVFRPATSYAVAELVADVSEAVHATRTPDERRARITPLLARFLGGTNLPERYLDPHPGLPITTYLVHEAADGSFSIAALVIRPGARTPLHDHQAWVVWGTYRGRDRETRYERRGGPGAFPELVRLWERNVAAGAISFIPPPPADVHEVANVGEGNSVSIHIHGTDIAKQVRNVYDPDRQRVLSFVQSYERVAKGGVR